MVNYLKSLQTAPTASSVFIPCFSLKRRKCLIRIIDIYRRAGNNIIIILLGKSQLNSYKFFLLGFLCF